VPPRAGESAGGGGGLDAVSGAVGSVAAGSDEGSLAGACEPPHATDVTPKASASSAISNRIMGSPLDASRWEPRSPPGRHQRRTMQTLASGAGLGQPRSLAFFAQFAEKSRGGAVQKDNWRTGRRGASVLGGGEARQCAASTRRPRVPPRGNHRRGRPRTARARPPKSGSAERRLPRAPWTGPCLPTAAEP